MLGFLFSSVLHAGCPMTGGAKLRCQYPEWNHRQEKLGNHGAPHLSEETSKQRYGRASNETHKVYNRPAYKDIFSKLRPTVYGHDTAVVWQRRSQHHGSAI